ncbi:glycosyl hydrolase family 8 [Amycolatopsis jejuensis]|uniref:glycosyl hydrolase family 8 n=1 Tax=Amycolatopsis jejuensis TaxID=330084 RepID=UPI000527C063|nr:glycosyl hydrolase family 8 [Amycolatopsis jejuensis]
MRAPRKVALFAAASVSLSLVGAGPAVADAVARPFPSHVTYRVGVMPSAGADARDAAVTKHYESWKKSYLRKACGGYLVHATDDAPNQGTVSEAQGYGMNIIPLMAGYDPDAKAIFDGLWKVVREHRDSQGMFQWQIDGKTCKYADGGEPDSATDGDLDVGYGLILADKQWGGYTSAAKDWLAKLWKADIASDGHLKVEDDGPGNDTRPSDFMLDHLRAFAKYDPAHDWNKVVTRTETLITQFTAKYSPEANLLSDFVVGADTNSPKPAKADYQENQPDNIVGYNSVRVPWHMGTDALLYGGSVATTVAKKESASYQSHAGGNPAKIYPHTKLDGTPTQTGDQSEVANNPVGVAAMAAGDQAWTDALWKFMAGNPYGDTYYGETVKMLVYLVMSGNYWAP